MVIRGDDERLAMVNTKDKQTMVMDAAALRSVVVATHDDGKKRQTDTTTMEVVELKTASHDPSVLTSPDSYAVVDMGRIMAGAADAMRAASAGEGASGAPGAPADTAKGPSVKDELKKEGVKAGIRGIRGRRKR